MRAKEKITNLVTQAVKRAYDKENISFTVERPGDMLHGDYATNIALVLSRHVGENPKTCAEKIASHIEVGDTISRVDIAGPGFINFFLTDGAVREELSLPNDYVNTTYSGKRVLVEHTSPNLFKPFHIGHLMNNIVGEFVVRAMKVGKAEVITLSFPSDVSLGIAKAMYVLLEEKKDWRDLSLEAKATYFGECYTKGVAYFEEHQDKLEEAKKLARMMYDKDHDSDEKKLFEDVRSANFAYFEDVIKNLRSHHDGVVYESEAGDIGTQVVKEHTGNVFTESEGAVVYIPHEDRKDIHISVFINSEGHPTYEAKDIGLIEKKFSTYNPDTSFFITDREQEHHFKVVFDAASKINETWKGWVEKSKHIMHGRMLFKGAKMSSRLGGVPLALEVVSSVQEEVREKAGEKIAHLEQHEKNSLEQEIALSALRISILRSKLGLGINFDPESSLSFEGDSGPYLMYTHARLVSLLEKGGEGKLQNVQVSNLERMLIHYHDVLVQSIETISPQILVTYLFSLAQESNGWYGREQIITDDKEKTAHNMALVAFAKQTLAHGLYVLGIQAPERM